MSLAKLYCKEIIKELDQIPVYLPGNPVTVGDVISFDTPYNKPIGSFHLVTNLKELGIPFETLEDKKPDPYKFASRGQVGASFTADADVASKGKGKLEISFSKEGATYLAALECTKEAMKDTSHLKSELAKHQSTIDWQSYFIVISVTTAKKALIMQSNTNSAKLTIDGEVGGLQLAPAHKVDASISLNILSYKDSSFIKDWSDDVTVFFDLVRYRKKFLSDWGIDAAKMLKNEVNNNDEYELISVYPKDLIE